jgi:polyketide cyclase/dehydrase/lipid transport protein
MAMGHTALYPFLASPRTRPARRRTRRLRAVLLALALTPIGLASAASTTWNAEERNGDVVVDASAFLAADIATAWRVLTDYERYGEFIEGVRRSVVHRDGVRVTVVQTLNTPCLLRVPVEITWRIMESPPRALRSQGSADRTSIDGRYSLTPVANGVRLQYTGRIAPARSIPLLGCEPGERVMAAEFGALASEIERQYGVAHEVPAPAPVPGSSHRDS